MSSVFLKSIIKLREKGVFPLVLMKERSFHQSMLVELFSISRWKQKVGNINSQSGELYGVKFHSHV